MVQTRSSKTFTAKLDHNFVPGLKKTQMKKKAAAKQQSKMKNQISAALQSEANVNCKSCRYLFLR